MKKLIYFSLLLISIFSLAFAANPNSSLPIYVIEIDGSINPATDDYLKKSIAEAEKYSAKLLVIKLNTPGGLLTSTQTMVESIFNSKVPIVVYVTPSGASATSAGVFITLAGEFAAMAPGTTIGAAHPVSGGGQNIEGDMREKVENYAASQIKAIAEQRNRNVKWAEEAVRKSVSITNKEAVKKNVVDFTAESLEDLLQKLEGKEVAVGEKKIVLRELANSNIVKHEMNFRQKVVNILSDPNVAMLIGLAAMLGLGIEFYNPGLIFPGVFGAICLVLSLTSTQVLPINYGGVALLILAFGFFIAEMFIPSFGFWGIAGIVCLILGSIYAIDMEQVWSSGGFEIDKLMVGSIAGVVGALLLIIGVLSVRSQNQKVTTGKEGLIGKKAKVIKEFKMSGDRLSGKVLVMGEIWHAELRSEKDLEINSEVTITDIENSLTLIVE